MRYYGEIESKTLYQDGMFVIRGYMLPDAESTPFDADCYSPENIQAWRMDKWTYVAMHVDVEWDSIVLGSAEICGIEHEHGDLAGVRADAWHLQPAITDGAITIMGSPLSGVIDEALSAVRTFHACLLPDSVTPVVSPFSTALEAAESWATRLD